MAFTTVDQVVAALQGQQRGFLKNGMSVTTQGWHSSHWGAGTNPIGGAAPISGLSGDVPTSATQGAFSFANAISGSNHLAALWVQGQSGASSGGMLSIYDRLWQNSGIVVTTATAQTVNSIALTRPDALGEAVEVWLSIISTTGAVAATPTISYTNQDGTAGRTGTCIGYVASAINSRQFPFALDTGDTGVRSIQSVTLGVSLVSGTISLVMRRCLARVQVNVSPDMASWKALQNDFLTLGLPRIPDNAAIELLPTYASTTGPAWTGNFTIING